MSNYLAVAAVTASLKRVLDEALTAGVPGAVANATVTTTRPETAANGSGDRKGINVYLYQVTPNAAWRNEDLPTRRSDGALVCKPQAALDLHYLLTFYGDETNLEPQRLLGMAVRTINSRPILTRDSIRSAVDAAILDEPNTYLQFTDLADAIETVKFSPLPLNLEELSKLWSVFFQTPYVLSVAYEGSVVLIEGGEIPRAGGPPVLDRKLRVVPFTNPVVDEVVAEGGPRVPVTTGTTVVVRGSNLLGDDTRLRLGPLDLAVPAGSTADEIRIAIPPTLPAGIHGVQVVQRMALGEPPAPHDGFESNVAPLVVRPRVVEPVTSAAGAEPGVTDVTIELTPAVGKKQRVSLLLDELADPLPASPRAYRFDAPSRDVAAAPDTSATVTIPAPAVQPGDYLVRVQVDGAESPLELGASGRFERPGVTMP